MHNGNYSNVHPRWVSLYFCAPLRLCARYPADYDEMYGSVLCTAVEHLIPLTMRIKFRPPSGCKDTSEAAGADFLRQTQPQISEQLSYAAI